MRPLAATLEADATPAFLSRVSQMPLRAGLRAGLVAAAATAGVVAGFGMRRGDWSVAFAALAADLLAPGGGLPRWLLVLLGGTVHAGVLVLWGQMFALLAHGRALATVVGAALVVTLLAALAAAPLVPAAAGAIRYAGLTLPHAWLALALMAAGFVTGRALSST